VSHRPRTGPAGAGLAGGGRSTLLTNRAQRLARVALFLMVQGQTHASRTAHLTALAE
jgi:hypothetical protein